jgi:hypothetical protein
MNHSALAFRSGTCNASPSYFAQTHLLHRGIRRVPECNESRQQTHLYNMRWIRFQDRCLCLQYRPLFKNETDVSNLGDFTHLHIHELSVELLKLTYCKVIRWGATLERYLLIYKVTEQNEYLLQIQATESS